MTTQITIHPEAAYDHLSPYQATREQAPQIENGRLWSSADPSFKDVLDTINPLQQIPVVSTIYRAMTGDTISTGSRLIGGALLGGPVGFALALLNEIFQSASGKDIGASMVASVTGEDKEAKVAENLEPTYAPPSTNRTAYEAYLRMQNLSA